jgi:hypothetical protein
VFSIELDDEPVPDRAAAVEQPVCGLTVRSAVEEIDALVGGGHRYFRPIWAPDVLGIILGEDTDWDEVGELLIESYCRLAPKMLAAQVDRPSSAGVAIPASGHRPAGRRMRLGLWGRLAGTGTVELLATALHRASGLAPRLHPHFPQHRRLPGSRGATDHHRHSQYPTATDLTDGRLRPRGGVCRRS